jgi:hypothetical protein
MTRPFQSHIEELAVAFASRVVVAARQATIADLLETSRKAPSRTPVELAAAPRPAAPPGRLRRRSLEDIERALRAVVTLLASSRGGLRAEQIRSQLGLDRREIPRLLKHGLETKRLVAKGEKRATTYRVV